MRNVLLLILGIALLPLALHAQQKTSPAKATQKATQAPPHYAPPGPQGPPQPPADLKMEYRKHGSPIPPLAIEKQNGSLITNAQLKKDKTTWLMIFSPQCDHCEHVVDSFKKMADRMQDIQLILVAEPRNKEFMDAFIKKTDIGSDPRFQQIGTDKGNLIYNIYNYQILPQLNIYNNKQKLEKTFFGNFMIDSAKHYMQ